jgi:type II secretion system protein H
MLILETGKKLRDLKYSLIYQEGGFALIEILVAILIMAIVLSVAILNIPNHDERYWRNDLDHLVSSLNAAQDESSMSGNVMFVQLDSQGWRFYQDKPINSQWLSLGNSQITSSVLIPDVYKPQIWSKSVLVESMQLTLGGELAIKSLNIPIAQDVRRATLLRNRNGRFSWVKG